MTTRKKIRKAPLLPNGSRMTPGKIYNSTRPNKKKMVYVVRGNKTKLVHFGDSKMQDYRQHRSEKRRKSFLARSGGIRNKSGKLTKNDPFSPNYYSRRYLWTIWPLICCSLLNIIA